MTREPLFSVRDLSRILDAISRSGITPFRYRRLRQLPYTWRLRAALSVLAGHPTIYGVTFHGKIPEGRNLLICRCTFKDAE